MAFKIRRVDYFYTTVKDQPGEAYKGLSLLASVGINLLATTAVPFGPTNTQLTIFPENTGNFAARRRNRALNWKGRSHLYWFRVTTS